jgi:tight adherence protein C
MNSVMVLAAVGVAAGSAGAARLIVPPTARLAPRVRPYSAVARSALGHRDMSVAVHAVRRPSGVLARLFCPPLFAVVRLVGRAVDQRGNDQLTRLLRQSGDVSQTADEYRVRQLAEALGFGAMSCIAVSVLLHTPIAALLGGVAGVVVGTTRSRKRLERVVAARAAQLRLELYTVNQLLAMDVRTGAGPMQAVQRLVDRGRGAAVGDLRDVLAWIRSGMGESAAFRRAAELSPEPSATRTYQLLAAGIERGVDLAGGLLALSEDIRDARREQLHKEAVRRRAAMLLPTIGILAPIMLLFIAAPLPSIVLGHR